MPSPAELQAQLDAQEEEILSLRQEVSALRGLRIPEADRVLASAVQEYRAGHRSDLAAARTLPVPYTREDKAAYSRALTEHYQAVRAYIRATSQQAKEPAPDV